MRLTTAAAAFVLVMGLPLAARAASCPEQPPVFSAGAKFAGEVRQVLDGRTICIGHSRAESSWFAVRLVDLHPDKPTSRGARRALGREGLGKYVVCTVAAPSDPTASTPLPAVCRVAGVSLGLRVANGRKSGL
ncbi:MAG TPA: hypothetical protein VF138_07100 [Caulobacteraceae bacterium]